jgi:hypothetical protein
MGNFVFGIITGIVVSTIGFSGVARVADRGVDLIKYEARNLPVDRN